MQAKTEKIWMDGKFVDWDNAKTHVLSHTLHYGAGSFEGIRFYNTIKGTAVFRLQEHIQRFIKSAKAVNMKPKYSEEELIKACLETVKINKIKDGYIRPIMYYGYGGMGVNPVDNEINTVIAVWQWGAYISEDPVKIKTSSYIRIHPKSSHTDSKICGHYVNSILAVMEAYKEGYQEGLLLDYKGNVAEGSGENIFYVKDGKLFTIPLGNILPGITRDSVMQIAKDNNIEVMEQDITVDDLKKADEVFFTGTAAEVTPIKQIDDSIIGNGGMGPITEKIKKIFLDAVNGKEEKYIDWLSFIK